MFTEDQGPVPHMSSTTPSHRSWLHSTWLRPFNDRTAIDDLIQRLLPSAALAEVRARVVGVIEETADTRSYVLRCNRHWRGFHAGQHVLVTMDMNGRRVQRCFSISSAADTTRRITITVKRQRGSGATAWMQRELSIGATLTLSHAFGAFRLPEPIPDRVLMLSAGSGITPMMSMLRTLNADGYRGDVVLLHACRNEADWIFSAELRAMAMDWPGLRVLAHFSESAGRLDAQRLAGLIPDFAQRISLLCGPDRLQSWVHDAYRSRDALERLRSETFGRSSADGETVAGRASPVHCEKSERSFTAGSGQPLLLAAEAAGMSPRHGCRIGICRSCQCRLRAGSVENLMTGEVVSEPGQWIQLCISAARSPLTLDL